MPESMNGSCEIHDVKKVGETNAELKNEEQTPSHYDHMICEKVASSSEKKPKEISYQRISSLHNKISRDYAEFENVLLGKSRHEIIQDANIISAMQNAHYYITEYLHEFSDDTIKGLLKLNKPLYVVAYTWMKYTGDLSDMNYLIQATAIGANHIPGEGNEPVDEQVIGFLGADKEERSVTDLIREMSIG